MELDREEKEPIIKERLIFDDASSDTQRGVFSEILKKTRKNRSRLQKEELQNNNNQSVDISAFDFDPTTSKLIHTIERGDTLEGIALKYNVTIAELMRENKLFTRAAFYGRKTLTISTTKEQLMRHIKLKQQHEEERQQKQHEQILTFCTEMGCDEDMAQYYLEQNHWDQVRAREKLKYDVAMAYKHSLTTYQPYDGNIPANSSTGDDSQKVEERQIGSNAKERALFFESPAERARQVHPLNKRQMKQLDQMSDIYEL